jgi:hypothetical protein
VSPFYDYTVCFAYYSGGGNHAVYAYVDSLGNQGGIYAIDLVYFLYALGG